MSWGGILFSAITIVFIGAAGMCAYESWALFSGKDPTVSKIVAYQFATHPQTAWVTVAAVMFVLGALTTHFVNWKP